jgi:peptide/nickel transport system permease protein
MVGLVSLASGTARTTDLLNRFQNPSWDYPMGTDQFGRNVLWLTIEGVVPSLAFASAAVLIGVVLGAVLAGLCAVSNALGAAIDVLSDVMLSLPMLIVALTIAATLGTGTLGLLVAFGVAGWTPYYRVIRAFVRAAKPEQWVEAAVASGASSTRIVFRHIGPNLAAPVVALAASRFGHAIISVSSLSFLGVGPQPPTADWGAALAAAQPYAERAPWAVAGPGLAIFFATTAAYGVGRRINARIS